MIFLVSIAIFLAIVMVQCFRTVSLIQAGAVSQTEGKLTVIGMMAAGALMSLPLLLELATLGIFYQGGTTSPHGDFLPLWFLGLGGVLALSVFGLRLHRQRTRPDAGFFTLGANAFGVLIGIYMLVVVADQVMFFTPSREDAGMVNWSFFRDEGVVKDIQCDSQMLVVKDIESEAATYRCPNGGVLVMGRFTGAPIVPWPHYTEGTSHELAVELRKVLRDSIKAD